MIKVFSFFVCFLFMQSCAGNDLSGKTAIEVPGNDSAQTYKLIWSDEFEGTSLNSLFWTNETGYIANNELQNYRSTGNHTVSDGTLRIYAKKVNDKQEFGSYTSARINTKGKKEFTYGRIEARMKLPLGRGTWPAFWTLGSDISSNQWPRCGEIDIMEYVGYDSNVIHGTIHSYDFNHMNNNQIKGQTEVENENQWHTYGITWTPDKIEFYVDDPDNPYFSTLAPSVKTIENWPFNKPHFLILNLAIGGMWGGKEGVDDSIFDSPVVMEVDYVRVFQKQ